MAEKEFDRRINSLQISNLLELVAKQRRCLRGSQRGFPYNHRQNCPRYENDGNSFPCPIFNGSLTLDYQTWKQLGLTAVVCKLLAKTAKEM